MKQYISEEDYGEKISVNLQTDQFGELEVLGAFIQVNEVRANWWEGVGYGGSITGRVNVSGGRVFLGACDKILYCLTMEGEELWRFETKGVILEGPAVSDDMVFLCSTDHNVYGIDKETGKGLWRFQAKDKIVEMPLYHEGRLYVGGCLDRNLYCLDAGNGREIWRFRIKDGAAALPMVHENRIYFGYGGNRFYCLDLNGKIIWTYPTKDTIAAWPAAVYNNKVYFGSWDCNIYCLDLKGKLVWKFSTPHPVMSPVVWKGRVCFSCWDNNVYCLDSETGSLKWKLDVNGFPGGLTSVYDGFIYVGSTDNNVYAIDIEKGRKAWKYNTNGFVSQIVSFDGRVYAGSWDCNLYCIDAKSGDLIWKFHTSMGSPSKITPPESFVSKSAQVIWQPETEKDKKSPEDEATIADYGTFSGAYIDTTKSDYLGVKKQGYVKKKGF